LKKAGSASSVQDFSVNNDLYVCGSVEFLPLIPAQTILLLGLYQADPENGQRVSWLYFPAFLLDTKLAMRMICLGDASYIFFVLLSI
jgi:hypothetical protein